MVTEIDAEWVGILVCVRILSINWVYYDKFCHILPITTTIDLIKSCIYATYHISHIVI